MSESPCIQQYDEVEATFAPQRTDDLKPGCETWIGRRARWAAEWIIEDGPYQGQWAMVQHETGAPMAWSPLCDLADVVPVHQP
jgi:hypothetical protein